MKELRFFDYSLGREGAPTLTAMVGPAGSGKSTVAKDAVTRASGSAVRLNRDTLREMLFSEAAWSHQNEEAVRRLEEEGIRILLSMGLDVVVDDTNCVARTRRRLEEIAKGARARFCLCVMGTDKEECKRRNALREGRARVADGVIDQHFKKLAEAPVEPVGYGLDPGNRAVNDWLGLLDGTYRPRLPGKDWIICDVDGTLADHRGRRGAYDETRVGLDLCREPVAAWVRANWPERNVAIFSGRHDSCSGDTCDWMGACRVPFDLLLMRPAGSSVSDVIAKQRMLDALLTLVAKEDIAFVLDDRPKVVALWKANGLKVYPVGGTTGHAESCTFAPEKGGWRECPVCYALEDF